MLYINKKSNKLSYAAHFFLKPVFSSNQDDDGSKLNINIYIPSLQTGSAQYSSDLTPQ